MRFNNFADMGIGLSLCKGGSTESTRIKLRDILNDVYGFKLPEDITIEDELKGVESINSQVSTVKSIQLFHPLIIIPKELKFTKLTAFSDGVLIK